MKETDSVDKVRTEETAALDGRRSPEGVLFGEPQDVPEKRLDKSA